jgi:hypothetical protein
VNSLDLWGGQYCRQPASSRLLWETKKLIQSCPPHIFGLHYWWAAGHSPEEQPAFSRSALWRAPPGVPRRQSCRRPDMSRRLSTRHAWRRTPQAPRTLFFIDGRGSKKLYSCRWRGGGLLVTCLGQWMGLRPRRGRGVDPGPGSVRIRRGILLSRGFLGLLDR